MKKNAFTRQKQMKQLIPGIFLLLQFLSSSALKALDPETPIHKYLLESFVIGRGIPTNTVTAIAQTPDGYLWVGTPDELVKYDGRKFETIDQRLYSSETDTRVNCLLVDREGALWIGIAEGVVRYQDGTFTSVSKQQGLPNMYITTMVEDLYGAIWIGTQQNYLYKYDFKQFTLYDTDSGLADFNINSLCADSKGNIWVGTFSEGLFKGYDGSFSEYELEGATEQYPYTIYSIYEDRKGVIWAGTAEGLFGFKSEILHHYSTQQGLSNSFVTDILEDGDGILWVGTRNGLSRILENPPGNISIENLLTYTEDEDDIVISRLFEDREKSLWIGTVGYDMKRLRNVRFFNYSRKEGIPNFRLTLYKAENGDIWVGSMKGELYRLEDGRFHLFLALENPAEATEITAIGEDSQGNIWFGTVLRGIFQLKDGKLIHYSNEDSAAPHPRYRINVIADDSKKNLWFCTYLGGLVCYRDGTFKTYTTADGLASDWVTNIHEDKNGNLWVGTYEGLTLVPGGRWNKAEIKNYLPGQQISALYEDNEGVYWIGAYNSGLVRLAGEKSTLYRRTEGLGSEYIFQIVEDTRGDLWMSSYDGVMKIDKKELNDFAAGKLTRIDCITFGLSDGMKSVLCSSRNRNSIIETPGGELWFATRKGIAAINPGKTKINKIPPPVVLEKIVFNYRQIARNQSGKRFKGIRDILFYFTAPTFISQERVRFKYRLEGYENDWILLEGNTDRQAHYQNLPYGDYIFRVTAGNSDGIWNNTGVTFRFTLVPRFHETLIFKLVIAILFIFMVFGIYYGLKKYLLFQKTRHKYKYSPLDDKQTETHLNKLLNLLTEEKIYKDPDISLDSLAQKLSIQPRLLSQLINEQLNQNFWGMINNYRMEEACRLLLQAGKKQQPILDIAFAVGFNSKEAFNRVFKKHTGMTPSQYKKENS